MQWITRTRWVGSLSLLLGLALFTPGCAMLEVGGHSRHAGHHAKSNGGHGGPPAHAPAHGYRRKHHEHGAELVFDSGLGVYVVVDLEDVFYHVGHYYRWHDARWSRSDRPDGGWKVVVVSELPAGLRSYGAPAGKPKKAKGPKHKSGPASPARR